MIEDISIMKTLPNMRVLSTSDDIQTKWAVEEISKMQGPFYLRLCRLNSPIIYDENTKFEIGKAIQFGEGKDATLITTGITTSEALKAQKELKKHGIGVRVLDIHTIKPIDKDAIIKCAIETNRIITIEDHNVIGGLGSSVSDVLCEYCPKKIEKMGIQDTFGKSGNAMELMKYFNIDCESIIKKFL